MIIIKTIITKTVLIAIKVILTVNELNLVLKPRIRM